MVAEIISPGGSPRVKDWAANVDEAALYLSILTIGEYEKGIANLPETDARRALYANTRDGLVARFADRVLPVSDPVVRRWGVISGTVRRRIGHPPPVIDTLLAATALEHDLHLVTRNIRDVQQTGASLFSPWEDDPADVTLRPKPRVRRRRDG